jgi:hypothetical protein
MIAGRRLKGIVLEYDAPRARRQGVMVILAQA